MNDLENVKKALVIGTGVSGINAAALLVHKGVEVILYDQKKDADMKAITEKLNEAGAGEKTEIFLGELTQEIIESVDLCVPSPGVSPESEVFKAFTQNGTTIWGEIELASRFEKGKLIAITGTNGKTTTTSIVGEIMKAWNPQVFVVGNIGMPYTAKVEETTETSVSVAEISSYQLETVETFKPDISAILNITPDHMDRHHTMEEYSRVKEIICRNQTRSEVCVLNYDDKRLREFANVCPARVVWFSRQEKAESGYWYHDDIIYEIKDGEEIPVLNVNETGLLGTHNYENMMAAIAITRAAGVPMDIAVHVICSFKAVEHRIEPVRERNGVMYYNDSKGTNPDASIKAIEAMVRPIILIGGGYDKGGEFDDYIQAFEGRVKELVLIGDTADRIEKTALDHGFVNVKKCASLEEAVEVCKEDAVPGDCVLLSPACASWDMFPNYEERGRKFKYCVNKD